MSDCVWLLKYCGVTVQNFLSVDEACASGLSLIGDFESEWGLRRSHFRWVWTEARRWELVLVTEQGTCHTPLDVHVQAYVPYPQSYE